MHPILDVTFVALLLVLAGSLGCQQGPGSNSSASTSSRMVEDRAPAGDKPSSSARKTEVVGDITNLVISPPKPGCKSNMLEFDFAAVHHVQGYVGTQGFKVCIKTHLYTLHD